MSRHIGIVGCSAEGAALCYRTICIEGAQRLGPHAHPEVSMHTHSLAHYVRCIERDDWPGVAALMLDSARKLAAAGADFFVCPDNTIHQAFEHLRAESPRPWLHIAEVVADEAQARGHRRLAYARLDTPAGEGSVAARGLVLVHQPREPRQVRVHHRMHGGVGAGQCAQHRVLRPEPRALHFAGQLFHGVEHARFHARLQRRVAHGAGER